MTTPCGYQQITVLTSSTGLTVPTAASQRPVKCRIVAETAAMRWRDDGTAPTASVGQPLAIGAELIYDGDLNAIRFIQQAINGVLNITYFY